jgi:hypothetical protein
MFFFPNVIQVHTLLHLTANCFIQEGDACYTEAMAAVGLLMGAEIFVPTPGSKQRLTYVISSFSKCFWFNVPNDDFSKLNTV